MWSSSSPQIASLCINSAAMTCVTVWKTNREDVATRSTWCQSGRALTAPVSGFKFIFKQCVRHFEFILLLCVAGYHCTSIIGARAPSSMQRFRKYVIIAHLILWVWWDIIHSHGFHLKSCLYLRLYLISIALPWHHLHLISTIYWAEL